MGLWGLDAPEEMGGSDLPWVALIAVNEQMGRTIVPYRLRPDSPNLRMLMATCNEKQREQYLAPYARGETFSAIAISEPGAGSDPAGMITRAERDGNGWVINGRKIWTTNAANADFTITMAITDKEKRARGGMSAFLVDKGTPGFNVLRKIPMLGGETTYEVAFEDCRVDAGKLLGTEGQGFAPMQIRLNTRRLQMACWGMGLAQRALDMMIEYAPQRVTFGQPLSDRQTVQNWVAEAATEDPRLPADGLRRRLAHRPGPRRAHVRVDGQGVRHRTRLPDRRSRHAALRRHGHDAGNAAADDAHARPQHAHLRRPDRNPPMGDRARPDGVEALIRGGAMRSCDLAIVGLGAVGSAALLAAARAGIDVIGVDRFSPPHAHGSTHGETRIVRAAIGEGADFTPLALRSFQLWDQLRDETGVDLDNRCGALILGGAIPHMTHVAADGFLRTTIEAAREYAIPHEILDAAAVRARFPAFATFDGGDIYYEPGAGLAYPERVVAAQLERAAALGAKIVRDTKVDAITQSGGEVRLSYAGDDIAARRVIVCAGAWTRDFIPAEWAADLTVTRQVQHWFDVTRDRPAHRPDRMPVFIWGGVYGFPMVGADGDGLKIATEDMAATVDPDAVPRAVTAADIAAIADQIRDRFPQLGARLRSTTCLYTSTPDARFRIGPHPAMDRVTVVSACSGHGFKHSAAVGEALALRTTALDAWNWCDSEHTVPPHP